MCGFTAILNHKKEDNLSRTIRAMTRMIAYRGPDGEGFLVDDRVALGHRRLAIIDLTPAAAQPMRAGRERYALVYNGEIYNFQELRAELLQLGYTFGSRSDTEVVLKSLIAWGPQAFSRFNGMFALLFYDREKQQILIARDRYGIKPLYLAETAKGFLLASEIKAFLKHPAFKTDLDLQSLNEYFTFQNVLGSRTLFKNVEHLAPGYHQVFQYAQDEERWQKNAAVRYWDFNFSPDEAIRDRASTAEQLRRLMQNAVTRQMQSDVPLGSYLSGGIDSGLIVAIASRIMPHLTTFTGGFDLSSAQGMESGYDERAAAEVLSNQFKTEHYEMVLHAGDMAAALPRLIWHLEELRLGQCYPNYYLSRLAGKFVKVVLSGAGGDELFAGYPWRYFRSANCSENGAYLRNYYQFWQRLVPDDDKNRLFQKTVLAQIDPQAGFQAFREVLGVLASGRNGIESNINRSLYFEAKTFLHGFLMIEDKLSMAHGLETRVPFLDNDLVDFACRIPIHMKLNNLQQIARIDENELGKNQRYELRSNDGKIILRQAIESLVPMEVVARAKQGFSSPDVSWYRGESLNYVNKLLTTDNPRIYNYLEPGFVRQVLDEHLAGRRNNRLLIWSFLCTEWWLRIFMENEYQSL